MSPRKTLYKLKHYVKGVRIRSFSGAYFPAYGLNTERYGVSLRIQSKCGNIQTTKTPNTDTAENMHFQPKDTNVVHICLDMCRKVKCDFFSDKQIE